MGDEKETESWHGEDMRDLYTRTYLWLMKSKRELQQQIDHGEVDKAWESVFENYAEDLEDIAIKMTVKATKEYYEWLKEGYGEEEAMIRLLQFLR